jgi:hypothetical protein
MLSAMKFLFAWLIEHLGFSGYFAGPFFEVFQLKVKVYTSKTYEDIRKGQDKFSMGTDQSVPLCGDIKLVFYNKPRLTKKKVRQEHQGVAGRNAFCWGVFFPCPFFLCKLTLFISMVYLWYTEKRLKLWVVWEVGLLWDF